jgi:hypothetical protein
MRPLTPDPRAQAAMTAMRRNREELLAAFAPDAPDAPGETGEFPRSATFRWIMEQLSARSLISTALTTALLRPQWLRLLVRVFLARRA